jgi:hypothetical protein
MIKKSYNFISKDIDNLLEMLQLRQSGWTFTSLSERYNCDRTSLRYQCRKYQIFPNKTIFKRNSNEVFDPKRIAGEIIVVVYPQPQSNWIEINGERINTGRDYADYLQ